MSARFQSNYDGPKKTTAPTTKLPATPDRTSSEGIQKLLMAFLTKPSMPQLCKAWAKSQSGFEAEVDRRLAEVRLERGDPNYARIGLWNTMASEGYAAASNELKTMALEKAKEELDGRLAERNELLAEPKSMEEALK
ncbi:unnamed protein product [Peniophora sp. CBMAI 1063]|nr:unnamed protein product [Peniophora sp. CBMAI 1063]